MKYRSLNNAGRYLSAVLLICLLHSCQTRQPASGNEQSGSAATEAMPKRHDWTGTYVVEDGNKLLTLKLHKRSVDGSYELQLYDNSTLSELYKSSIYDARDSDSSITIRFLNNFQQDAQPLGFESGDTLFTLQLSPEGTVQTQWNKVSPASSGLSFTKTSDTY